MKFPETALVIRWLLGSPWMECWRRVAAGLESTVFPDDPWESTEPDPAVSLHPRAAPAGGLHPGLPCMRRTSCRVGCWGLEGRGRWAESVVWGWDLKTGFYKFCFLSLFKVIIFKIWFIIVLYYFSSLPTNILRSVRPQSLSSCIYCDLKVYNISTVHSIAYTNLCLKRCSLPMNL